jgi:hypothetical protein
MMSLTRKSGGSLHNLHLRPPSSSSSASLPVPPLNDSNVNSAQNDREPANPAVSSDSSPSNSDASSNNQQKQNKRKSANEKKKEEKKRQG